MNKIIFFFIFYFFLNQAIAKENIMILKLKDGEVIIDVAADVFSDAAGNLNTVASQFICTSSLAMASGLIPDQFGIEQNYPNPFNPVTKITYGIPVQVNVQIIIYNLSGRRVVTLVNQTQLPGYHSIYWNADDPCRGAAGNLWRDAVLPAHRRHERVRISRKAI